MSSIYCFFSFALMQFLSSSTLLTFSRPHWLTFSSLSSGSTTLVAFSTLTFTLTFFSSIKAVSPTFIPTILLSISLLKSPKPTFNVIFSLLNLLSDEEQAISAISPGCTLSASIVCECSFLRASVSSSISSSSIWNGSSTPSNTIFL